MITIGIPVYNCPIDLIHRCFKSVLHQTIDDIEILIVNDCCTDETMKYVLQLTNNYLGKKLIRIINHKKNTGIGGARNTILKEAKGEYIFLIDCDDYIKEDSIEKLYKNAQEFDADAVWGSVMTHVKCNDTINVYNQNPNKVFQYPDELAKYAFSDSHVHLLNAVWNILIRLEFIRKNNLTFETECGACDDYVFTFKMIPLIKNAVLIQEPTYFWVIRDGSQSNPIEKRISSRPLRMAIIANNILKKYCHTLMCKSYYEGYCLRVNKESFFNAHAIVKLRKRLDSPISNKEIKESISPIDSIARICKYKKYRKDNMVFWGLAKLPSFMIPYALRILYFIRKT